MPMSDYMRRMRERVGNDLIEVPSVSVLTYDDAGRVLLVRHAELDGWTTPGGAVEPEERPADAALREMWEETGLEVELVRILGVYGGPEFTATYANGDRVSFAMTVFEGRRIGGSPRPDGEETLDVEWFPEAQLDALRAPPWLRRVLANASADRAQPHWDPPLWRPPRR